MAAAENIANGGEEMQKSFDSMNECSLDSPTVATDTSTVQKAKRPLALPTLRVEQLREEGVSSPQSPYTSEDSEYSDTDIVSRLGEFIPPSEDLCMKITEQMEYYFSDAYILKDSFLLKHVRRNKEGYVNLKLITSFKKMKTLSRDYRVVAFSLRKLSKTLLVNEEGNKAKRRDPLPDYDETKSSRTVLAVNLPVDESAGLDVVTNIFKQCGDISMLQIYKPGKSIPSDVKKYLSKHPEVNNYMCAVIEFEKHASAANAVELSTAGDDWTQGLKVIMFVTGKTKAGDDTESEGELKQKNKSRKKAVKTERDSDYVSSGSEGDFLMPKPRSRQGSLGSDSGRNGYGRALVSPNSTPDKQFLPAPASLNQRRRSVPLPQSPLVESPKNTPKQSPKPSPRSSPKQSPEMRRRASYGSAQLSTDGSNSWMQRRLQTNREVSPLAKDLALKRIDGIIRAPIGPAKAGNGFNGGKGRGKPIIEIEC